jgi:hypothetical protein
MKESENLMPPEMATNLTPTKAKPITGLEMQFKTPDHMMSVSVANEDGTKPYFGWCHGWSEQGGNTGGEAFNGSAEIPFTSGSWRVGCENYNQETGDFWRSDEQSVTITPGTSSMSFVLKKSNFEPPQSTTATFDCTVAQTISLDDGTSVAIPANALATEGNCTVTASPTVNMNYSSESKPAIGYGYDLTALDGSNQVITGNFNSAVTLTIQAPTDAELAEIGLTLDDIIPKFFDESSQTWQNVAGSNVDQELNQYSIQMTHFTVLSLNTGATTGVGGGAKTIVVSPKASGGPQVTTWNGSGARQSSTMAYATTFRGGVTSVMGDLDGDGSNEIVTAPASAGGAHIRVFDADGNLKASLFPYTASFRGGLSLALGNLDDDAALELIVAPQIGGGPHVRSFDYADGAFTVHSQFFSHPVGLRSGVSVKTGDTNGDRTDDIIVSTNTGAAPHVRSFNGEGQLIGQFMAFPVAFRGGVNVTVADVNGDGKEDIVVSPKSAGGPQVRVLRPNGTLISQFYAFPSNWRLGLVTAVGDLDANGANEIVVAPQSGGSHVRYFNANGQLLGNYVAPYPVAYRGGLELAVGNVASEDPNDEIVVAPRLGGGPHVIVYDIVSASDTQFMALHPQFRGGVNLSLSQ